MDTLHTIVILAVLVFLIISLYKEWFKPAVTFLIAVVALSLFGVITAEQVLKGFANEHIAAIILLLLFGNILGNSAFLTNIFNSLFKSTKTYGGFMIKLLPSIAASSAFMNNTPIVALLIPQVRKWGRTNNIATSKLLIPISYAAILGGTMTLIGTATNMLVNALAQEGTEFSFNLFDFTIVGLPLAVLGILYLILFGNKLLPNRKSVKQQFNESSREYLVEVTVPSTSQYIGKTINEANLRQLKGLFVVEIIRGEQHISPVKPDDILLANDKLILAGDVDAVTDLLEQTNDLALPKHSSLQEDVAMDIVELVVTRNSFLGGKTVKDANFRERYKAALVGVSRGGERQTGKIGNIELRTGDTLLALAEEGFLSNSYTREDFFIISKLKEIRPLPNKQALLILIGLAISIILSATGILSLFKGLIAVLALAFLTKTIDLRKIRNLFDYNLLIIAALALAIGQAVQNTGIADVVANNLISVSKPIGVLGILVGLYLITMLFTELMTNVAAASLTVPLAIALANALGDVPLAPFLLVVAFAASASFITPIGYQTNLMVYGPGGYKFKDFLKIGLPLSIIYFVATIAILYWKFFM